MAPLENSFHTLGKRIILTRLSSRGDKFTFRFFLDCQRE